MLSVVLTFFVQITRGNMYKWRTKIIAVVAVMMWAAYSPKGNETVGHYEVITFQLHPQFQPEQFLSINKEVEGFLKSQQGFLTRSIGQINDSVWVDVLGWRSKTDFEKAFENSASDQTIIEMSKMINETSYQILSFEPILHTN